MSFAFGFGGDDIEEDEDGGDLGDQDDLAGEFSRHSIADQQQSSEHVTPTIPPKRHSLEEMVRLLLCEFAFGPRLWSEMERMTSVHILPQGK